MIPLRHVRHRFSRTLATAALLAMASPPAWSACNPPRIGGRLPQPFDVDGAVVVQRASNLAWQRCSLGQSYGDGACHGSVAAVDWVAAGKAAAAAGAGWRLPTSSELNGLILSYCSAPATDTAAFPTTSAGWYWTASADGTQGAWFADFSNGGGNGAALRTLTAAVRLVRSGAHVPVEQRR